MNEPSIGVVPLASGRTLSFSVQGAPRSPPLLLNRPIGGSMLLWGEFARRLATALRVVSFDPLGVGQSSDVPLWYTTRDMARDAAQVLDHLRIESAHVFGLSLGGMVASYVALDFTARVRSLILASTIPEPEALSLGGFEELLSMSRFLFRPSADVEAGLVHGILSREFRKAHPQRVTKIERLACKIPTTRENLAILALAAARHSSPLERLPQSVRTLLLFGELDLLAGAGARDELRRELPNAECEIIAGAGHDISLERPRALADRVLAFALRG
ncbi:MAG: alpha/beta hydrolase [Pseudomonadota bacterium]